MSIPINRDSSNSLNRLKDVDFAHDNHIRAVSASSSRLTDAMCNLLSQLGIHPNRHAIINVLNAVSGGRLGWFTCFFSMLGCRLQGKASDSNSSYVNDVNAKKKAQRAIKRL